MSELPTSTSPPETQWVSEETSLTQNMSESHPALAKLYGEPVFSIPADLYIPPEALEIFLDSFEGPLDFLLYLIRKQGFDILDIPMARVTEQYLRYVDQVKTHNLELAADYLVMAAMLIEIKSRMLLPRPKNVDESEPADPRAELARRLMEYERIKLAASQLDEMPIAGRDYRFGQIITPIKEKLQPQVSWDELQQAWQDVVKRAKLSQHHVITRESLSVHEYMSKILKTLRSRRFLEFSDVFAEDIATGRGLQAVVVTFVALLELCRESLILITQVEAYAPIYVRLSYTDTTQNLVE